MLDWIKKKIGRKTFVLMITTVVLPIIIITGINFLFTRSIVSNMIVDETEQLFREGKKSLTNYFENIDRASLFVYYNQVKEKSLSTVLDQEYDSEAETFILETLSTIRSYDDHIEQVYLAISEIDRAYLLRSYMLVDDEVDLDATEGSLMSTEKEVYIDPVHPIKDYNLTHIVNYERDVVSFVRNIYVVPSNQHVGQLVIDLDKNLFDDLLGNLYKNEEDLYLVDLESRQIIYSTEEDKIKTRMNSQVLNRALDEMENDTHNFEWNDNKGTSIYVVDRITERYMDYLIIKTIPISTIYAELNSALKLIMILLFLLILLVLLASTVNTYIFTRPINALVHSIRSIREGDIKSKVEVTNEDEYGELQVHFNEMMDSINDHIEQEYKLQIENTKNELKALQSQINPHFMNNTLQAIGTEMLKEGNTKAYRLVTMLGRMLKYSMGHKSPIVPIEEEVDYSKSYLELQKHRFSDQFTYEIHVDKKVLECMIPKMTLQPLLENYFKHGLDKEQTDSWVKVDIFQVEQDVHIEISNNGKTVIDEVIDELNQKLNEGTSNVDESIGLVNVSRRLKLHYHNQAAVSVSNMKGNGFKIDIVLKENIGTVKYYD